MGIRKKFLELILEEQSTDDDGWQSELSSLGTDGDLLDQDNDASVERRDTGTNAVLFRPGADDNNNNGFEKRRQLWRQQYELAKREIDEEAEDETDTQSTEITPAGNNASDPPAETPPTPSAFPMPPAGTLLASILPSQTEFDNQNEWLAAAFEASYEAGRKDSEQQIAEVEDRMLEAADIISEKRMAKLRREISIEMAPLIQSIEPRAVESAPEIYTITEKRNSMGFIKQLTKDTFNFLLTAPVQSLPFLLGLAVFLLQVAIFMLASINMINLGDTNNPFQIPANVTPEVRVIQFLAVLVSIALQDDLVTCLDLLKDGYTERFQSTFENVTPLKFTVAATLRFMVGCLSLLVMFLLIVSSTTVIDVLLNFTAVHFVSGLDELFFYLSSHGILGQSCGEEAQLIENTSYSGTGKGYTHWQLKATQLGVVLIIMLCSLGIVVRQQNSAAFVCRTVQVQFGDDLSPALGFFSGLYDKSKNSKNRGSRRVEYIERKTRKAKFAYCTTMGAWTFTWIERNNTVSIEGLDPCNWQASSSPTQTFDLTQTASATWYVQDDIQRVVVLSPFYLACADCQGNSGDCTGRGSCSNAVCNCDEGWFGLQCEFRSPCESLATDARFDGFPIRRGSADQLQLLRDGNGPVTVYHRPVYMAHTAGTIELIFFIGRRWVLTHAGRIAGNTSDLAHYFRHEFHAFWTTFGAEFISEPRDIGTQGDASTPVAAEWYLAAPLSSKSLRVDIQSLISSPVDTMLVCATCDNQTNPCLYNGVCNSSGTCQCIIGSEGALCEEPPIGDGRCDTDFNTIEFGLDGGDCCEQTCESSSVAKCGCLGQDEYVSTGYYFCKLPPELWIGQPLDGQAGSYSGFALDLSQRSMAVGDLLQDRVRVYEKVGSTWIQRYTISGAANSFFGTRIAVSAGNFNSISNPSFRPPLTVAILDGGGLLWIYKCNFDGCTKSQVIPQVSNFHLSAHGNVLAIIPDAQNGLPTLTNVFESLEGMFQLRANISFADPKIIYATFAMAQNGDGSTVVLHKQQLEVDVALGGLNSRGETFEVYSWNGTSYHLESQVEYKAGFNAYSYEFSLDMSEDGSVLAYGIQSCSGADLKVFDRGNDNTWIERTPPPIHKTNCLDTQRPLHNNDLALSGDGSVVAFRLGTAVTVFRWESENWIIAGQNFSGMPHYPVALSSDGKELAIGSPENGFGGTTTVHSLPGGKQCPSSESLLRISLTLDRTPFDLFWDLKNTQTGEILYQEGPYPLELAFGTIVEEECLDTEAFCYEFTIYNQQNGGLQAPGEYALFLDGINIALGRFDGLYERVFIGNCT